MAYSALQLQASSGTSRASRSLDRRNTSVSKQNSYRRNSNTVRHERTSTQMGPVSTMLLVGLLITIAGLLYLVQITKTSVYGFEVSELKQQQTELQAQNETLRVEAARLQSLERVEGSEFAQEYQPANDLTFLPE